MADQERLAQAAQLEPDAARHLLDLQLEGIREAPLGVVVCCDRRTPAAGVLGRATFPDTDLWSCACAIQNLWLAARAEGLGMGWVTLFDPAELGSLLGPARRRRHPGLAVPRLAGRAAAGTGAGAGRLVATAAAVGRGPARTRWTETAPPVSKLRAPAQLAVVAARDESDRLLTPPGSLGVLDRAVDRVVALGHGDLDTGVLVLAGASHRVVELGVSAFDPSVTADVLAAAREGTALGTVAATAAGLQHVVVDCGGSSGDLAAHRCAQRRRGARRCCDRVGDRRAGAGDLVALGEVGIGNTTVAAALAAHLLPLPADQAVGLGSGADTAMLERKREVVAGALARVAPSGPEEALAALGGPEVALLTGVVLGAAQPAPVIVLDGLLTSVAALCAVLMEPAVAQHLVAGQRSREQAHAAVLDRLGLEPLLDLRMRAGEGAGACFAAGLLLSALRVRRETARTGS